MSTSSNVVRHACPMCSDPVTFGGGIAIVYGSRSARAPTPARKYPPSSQNRYHRGSTSRESYAFGISLVMRAGGLPRRALFAGEALDLFADDRLGEIGNDLPDDTLDDVFREREHAGDLILREAEV